MGQYADHHIAEMTELELQDFETLMEVPDQDIYAWISGQVAIPANYETEILKQLTDFHVLKNR